MEDQAAVNNPIQQPTAPIPQEPKRHSFLRSKLFLITLAILILFTIIYTGIYLYLGSQLDKISKSNQTAITSKPSPSPDPTANWKTYMFGKVSFKYPPNYIVKTNGALGPVNIADLKDANRYMNIDISEKSITEHNDLINSYITSPAFSNIKKELIQNGILITADGPGYPNTTLWVLAFLRKNNTTIYIENTGYDVPKNIFDQILATFKFTNQGNQVVCTQDAKLCPDGSYVSRRPPNCEFSACPQK